MQLQAINKTTYRKHLKVVIACAVITLFVVALGSSSVLIYFMGNESGSNFILNLAGVLLAAGTVGLTLNKLKHSPFMFEVVYVWRLKQELNVIYRHSAALKPALESNDPRALVVNYFNLKGSIQLYELDDNTLTLEDLKHDLSAFEEKLEALELSINANDYCRDLLKQLKS